MDQQDRASYCHYWLEENQIILRMKKPFRCPSTLVHPTGDDVKCFTDRGSMTVDQPPDNTCSNYANAQDSSIYLQSGQTTDHGEENEQKNLWYMSLEIDVLLNNQWIHFVVADEDVLRLKECITDKLTQESIESTLKHRNNNSNQEEKTTKKRYLQDFLDTDVIIVEENGYLEGTAMSGSSKRSLYHIIFDISSILFAFLIICSFLVLSAIPFWAIEKWTFERSISFSVDTLTKVGFGDLVPLTVGGKIYNSFCIILGLPLLAAWSAMVGTRYISITSHSFNIFTNFVSLDEERHSNPGIEKRREKREYRSQTNMLRKWMWKHKSIRHLLLKVISSHFFRILLQILFIVAFLLLGSMVFSLTENWTYGKSVYFSLCTLTTYVSVISFCCFLCSSVC